MIKELDMRRIKSFPLSQFRDKIFLSIKNNQKYQALDLYFNLINNQGMYSKIGSPQASTCAKVIRGFNIIAAVLLVAFGIVGLVYMIINNVISEKFFLIFSPVFIVLFGAIMIAVQFKITLVMETFDFLGSLIGKGIFYIYLSSQVFFFFSCEQDQTALAWISSMIIFGLGITYLILNFCEGDYQQQVRQRLN